jgi:prepilin-type N-terminal cleavage/methylation domain-containing protein
MSRRQRGFTLIELMVALVVSTLLVGMILSIFSRMSLAYRGQQQISSVQQVLAAARATFELDAKQAGLQMPQGFWLAPDHNNRNSPLQVIDQANTLIPDEIRFVYADLGTQAMILNGTWSQVNLDANPGFVTGDLVVVSTANGTQPGLNVGDADIAMFDACVLQISNVTPAGGTQIDFSTAAPYGSIGNAHCNLTNPAPIPNKSMLYKLVAHAYRIDPDLTRAADGVLQVSPTGNLFNNALDWQDLAYGFTDIQIAVQFFELNDLTDDDGDLDPQRDFWTDNTMFTRTQPTLSGNSFVPPRQLSISLVARTDKEVEGIATSQTPRLTLLAKPNNNRLGNHDSVNLPSLTDTHLMGSRIYRYTTFQVDLRNLGVGK